jgi:hypothetical protein
MAQLPPFQRLRLIVDGVVVPTSAIRLRRGEVSHIVYQLLADFEADRARYIAEGRQPPIGFATTYTDHAGKSHGLQIDLA